MTSIPWYKTPQWWAVIIASISGILSVFLPLILRSYPPKPKVKMISFLPVLTYVSQEDGTMADYSFKGVAEFYNDSDISISINEMIITGDTRQKDNIFNIAGKTPTYTLRILGRSCIDNIVPSYSTAFIKYDFLDFTGGMEFDAYFGKTDDPQTWKVAVSEPSMKYLIKIENGIIMGLSDDFFTKNLIFNYIIGEKILAVKKRNVMDLAVISKDVWEHNSKLFDVLKDYKQKSFRKKELDKLHQ